MARRLPPRGPSRAVSTAVGSRLKVPGSMSANSGVARARRIALHEAKKLKGVVITAAPGPMPAAARASQSASVPEEHPMAWDTPSCPAAARSKTATGSPRINCCVSRTCPIASSNSWWIGRYWRLRSSMGTAWAFRAEGVTGEMAVSAALFTSPWYQPGRSRCPASGLYRQPPGATCSGSRLKSPGKEYIVVTLRESTEPGLPVPCPSICWYVQLKNHPTTHEEGRRSANGEQAGTKYSGHLPEHRPKGQDPDYDLFGQRSKADRKDPLI